VSQDSLDQYPATALSLADLNIPQLLAVMWFSTTFAEEAERRDLSVGEKAAAACREQSEANLQDAVEIMHFALTYRGNESIPVMKNGFDCYYAWVLYSQRAWSKSHERLGTLRLLIQPALECCIYDGMDEAVDHVAELLSNYGSFWDSKHREAVSSLLRSPWGQQRMVELQAEDSAWTSFAKLLLAFGDIAVQDIAQSFDSVASLQIMGMFCQPH